MKNTELVAVIDKAGRTIDYVPRYKLGPQHTWKIISVWIENSQGEALMQQRSYQKALAPGLWTPAVEGTVEKDDSFLETAKREIAEEIGLTNFKLIPAKKIFYKAEFGLRLAQGYRATTDWPIERFTIQKEELEQLAWMDKQTVIKDIKAADSKYPVNAFIWLDMFDLQ